MFYRIGLLPGRQAKSRKNPFSDSVREVRVKTEAGTILRILCNDLGASAQEIIDLYKRRWVIELFFCWVKQIWKIRHFLGTSEDAVRLQIAVALSAFLGWLKPPKRVCRARSPSLGLFTQILCTNAASTI